MDYSAWPRENAFQAELGDLNLLEPPDPQASGGDAFFGLQGELRPSVEEERVAKRSREAIERESLESFLRELAKEPDEPVRGEQHHNSSGDEKRAAGRQPSDAAAAARAKAGRERARRERLNESFQELAKVLDPAKAAKTDKTSTIADAIRIVTQLRAENGQLRQLNKFLEERTQNMEKLKCELALQLQLIQQQQAGGAAPGPSGHMQPGGMMPHYMPGPAMAMGAGAMGMGPHFGGMVHPMQLQGMHAMAYLPQQAPLAGPAPARSVDAGAAHSSAGTLQATAGEGVKDELGSSMSGGIVAGRGKHGMMARSEAPAIPVGPAGFMSAAEVDTSLDSTRRPPAA
ncbi:hypothetical protein WJX81_002805 [Elliptochloris bilobata]|uniref:BHLH domain-containing protein n=1 Tax=Elliptochloris bilobata TaxID=381761 RepID=A0AAW1S4A4_9CHLO